MATTDPPPSPPSTPPPTLLTSSSTGTFYFAYGSNLSTTQMSIRCQNDPSSCIPVAIARLDHHQWIICQRGYANVVASPPLPSSTSSISSPHAPEHTVYGLLYNLSAQDEARLDLYEGHDTSRNPKPTPNPDAANAAARPFLQGDWDYNKQYLPVTITKWLVEPGEYGLSLGGSGDDKVTVLVYIDEWRTEKGEINEEYIGRMNRGIREALALGLDEAWVESVMREDIPRDGEVSSWGYVGEVEGYVEKGGKGKVHGGV